MYAVEYALSTVTCVSDPTAVTVLTIGEAGVILVRRSADPVPALVMSTAFVSAAASVGFSYNFTVLLLIGVRVPVTPAAPMFPPTLIALICVALVS